MPFVSQALEYLLWACMCMESSVQLLSVRYLKWRATLYTAVCQCYYDCQAGVHGEVCDLNSGGSDTGNTACLAFSPLDELKKTKQDKNNQRVEMKPGQKFQPLFEAICVAVRAVDFLLYFLLFPLCSINFHPLHVSSENNFWYLSFLILLTHVSPSLFSFVFCTTCFTLILHLLCLQPPYYIVFFFLVLEIQLTSAGASVGLCTISVFSKKGV